MPAMKPVLRPLCLLIALGVSPVFSADALAPEQRVDAIEQRYLSGDRRGAEKDVKSWMKAEEKAPWPWVAEARLSFHEKKYKRCLSQAEEALERAPQNAAAYYWRGRCFEAKGNTLDAANEYRAALKAEAAYPEAHEGLARIQAGLDASGAAPKAN
jgi:predicted Zn-dependent protease